MYVEYLSSYLCCNWIRFLCKIKSSWKTGSGHQNKGCKEVHKNEVLNSKLPFVIGRWNVTHVTTVIVGYKSSSMKQNLSFVDNLR